MRKATYMSGLDPMLVLAFIYLLLTGWNWSQATAHRNQAAEYRSRKAALDTREHARLEAAARSPRAIPARVYELTYQVLEHAVRAELADLAVFSLTTVSGLETCGEQIAGRRRRAPGLGHRRHAGLLPAASSLAGASGGHLAVGRRRWRELHGPARA